MNAAGKYTSFEEKDDHMRITRNTVARGIAVVVVTAFLSVLGWYLFQPDYSWTRLALFVVLGALAVVATAGMWYQRKWVAAGGVTGLFLLTVTLAGTLWMFLLPVIVVLAIATVVMSNNGRTNTLSIG